MYLHLHLQVAMRREWRALNPDHRLMGCSIHFAQAIQRRVQEGGMSQIYNSDKSVKGKAFKGVIWMVLGLPMIPINL